MHDSEHAPQSAETVSAGRTVFAGFLMGLANLVPGVSGGTMILVVGLYEKFIDSIAQLSRLRLKRGPLFFMGLIFVGAIGAILLGSGVAVAFVRDQRWAAYSLFLGLTLGGVPLLWKLARPISGKTILGFALGFGFMLAYALEVFALKLDTSPVSLVIAGALAATSMILPGISGSYVLLVLGLYEVVVGSASVSALRADPGECGRILVPVAIGAGLGVALLTNLLKWMLARHAGLVYGVLLGLLLGSVLGLWPFAQHDHPELLDRGTRKAAEIAAVGGELDAAREKLPGLTPERFEELREAYAGRSKGELRQLKDETTRYVPGAGQAGSGLVLLLLGFGLTRVVARRGQAKS